MSIRDLKPYTAGVRHRVVLHFRPSGIDEPKLKQGLKLASHRAYGRNHRGVKTQRYRCNGHKRYYRVLKPRLLDLPGVIRALHYDPYRNARLALITYGSCQRYTLWTQGFTLGQNVVTGVRAPIALGNRLPLYHIPLGCAIHDIEMHPGQGGQLVRAGGTHAMLLGKETKYASIRLPSGEIRYVLKACWATVGAVGNSGIFNATRGKAGVSRHCGRRPKVRGSAMNPCDHPHGGGEGRSPIGRSHPVSLWGKPALGVRTRKRNKPCSKHILQRRKRGY